MGTFSIVETAGVLPQHTFNAYTKAFNKGYEHNGTLFEGSFQVIQVHNVGRSRNAMHFAGASHLDYSPTSQDPTLWHQT